MKSQSDKAEAEAKAAEAERLRQQAEADRRQAEMLAQMGQQRGSGTYGGGAQPRGDSSDLGGILHDVLNVGLPLLGSIIGF